MMPTAAYRSMNLAVACILSVTLAWAQTADLLPRGPSVASTHVARTDVWAAFDNPAGLVQENKLQIACQYENRYLIPQISTQLVQVAWSSRWGNVGVACTHFGYKHYGETTVGLCLARSFGGRFSLGFQANCYAAYMGEELGYRAAFIPQMGLNVLVGRRTHLGVQAFNPFGQRLRGDVVDKELPSLLSVGSDMEVTDRFRWMLQADSHAGGYWRAAAGAEWQMVDLLCVKLGAYATDGNVVGCLGFGLSFGPMKFDLNCELHPILGLCTLGRLSYSR